MKQVVLLAYSSYLLEMYTKSIHTSMCVKITWNVKIFFRTNTNLVFHVLS